MILLDTHVLVWWLSGQDDLLSASARQAIERERSGEMLVSSISAWEIAMLVARDRLVLSMDVAEWLRNAGEIESLTFMPVDNEIAVRSTELPGVFHKDPADRIIVATSRKFGASLVTADRKLLDYDHVQTIW